jgi:Protein of unknown function (DUF2726)
VQTELRPYFRRRYLLTSAEQAFYKTLREIVGDFLILPKVRLADLIDADDRHKYWQANFNRVKSKHIDFVLCDSKTKPLIAIELDDPSHEREDRRNRDNDVDRLFAAVSFPLLRVRVQERYEPGELSRQLLTKLVEEAGSNLKGVLPKSVC